jgi:hypothetical protein
MIGREKFCIAALAALCVAVFASPAAAVTPPSVTTLAATNATDTSVILNGTVRTNGALTAWQFLFGTSRKSLKPYPLPAGTIEPTSAPVPVAVLVTHLKPHTRYLFQLVATHSLDAPYYPLYAVAANGRVLSFTTPKAPLRVALRSRRLQVKNGAVTLKLRCPSRSRCKGRLSLTITQRSKPTTLSCVTGRRVSLAGRATTAVVERLSKRCVAALGRAPHHKANGTLSATWSTGEAPLRARLTLFR